MECRLNAEDPENNFAPQPGKITHLFFPDGSLGVRIDAGVTNGSFISPFYDSMIAKLIVHLNDRNAVIAKMKRVLSELEITGVITNQAFLYELVTSDRFKQGTYSTSFIENDVLAGRRGLNAAKSV